MTAVTDFLQSLRADLFDRRMLPVLIAIAVLLLGAIAYVVLGGGESSRTPLPSIAAATPSAASGTTGIAVSQVSGGSTGAVAEVTSGESLQHSGPTRDPLAGPVSAVSGKSAAGAVSGSSSGTASAPATTPATTPATPPATTPGVTTPKKAPAGHSVDVQFGVVPAGTSTLVSDLTTYANLRTVTPFPSAAENLIELVAVSAAADAARFRFIQPMIPTGAARCVPSPTQCEVIDLKPGEFEQLEYAPPSGGPTVLYQLELIKIS